MIPVSRLSGVIIGGTAIVLALSLLPACNLLSKPKGSPRSVGSPAALGQDAPVLASTPGTVMRETDTPTPLPLPTGTPTPLPPTASPKPSTTPLPPAPTAPLATATPEPPAAPTDTPVPPSPKPPPTVAPVQVYEDQITVPTYQYENALVADPKDSFYPYQRLDFGRVGGPIPKTYRTIVLENRYLRMTILPDLGGRIYRVVFKPTSHDVFYRNPVIKPSHFGFRGWWLATGGMEFALPTDEHGLNEYVKWETKIQKNPDGSASVVASDVEKTTQTRVTVEIKLSPDSAAYSLNMRLENTSTVRRSIQYWVNAMLAPGGANAVSARTEFVFPSGEMTVHSTGDRTLPQAHGVLPWPVYNGRDLSWFANWNTYLGLFAKDLRATFVGAYNHDADEGVVRVTPTGTARGAKLFAFGRSFDKSAYTDDGSSYFEIWGGLTPTFWDYYSLDPGASVGWTEQWYPVARIGGLKQANADAALAIVRTSQTTVHIGLFPTKPLAGRITVSLGGEIVYDGPVDANPADPLNLDLDTTGRRPGAIEASVLDTAGTNILQYRGAL